MYHHFDGMCWPVPCRELDNLEYGLRYWEDGTCFLKKDRLLLASVIAAYRSLIWQTNAKRNAIAKEIRGCGGE